MTTLENLYHGNIAPHEFSVERGSEYESLAKLVARHDQQRSIKSSMTILSSPMSVKKLRIISEH